MTKTLDLKINLLIKTNKIDHFKELFSLGSINEGERLNMQIDNRQWPDRDTK